MSGEQEKANKDVYKRQGPALSPGVVPIQAWRLWIWAGAVAVEGVDAVGHRDERSVGRRLGLGY